MLRTSDFVVPSLTLPKLARPKQARPQRSKTESPDAFCHETDALDYCDEQIVAEFCYNSVAEDDALEPYMQAYREAVVTPGMRLEEWAFEDMNSLPRGFMDELRKFCDFHADLRAWTKLSDMVDLHGALCFILQGSLSVIQHVPLTDEAGLMQTESHGFSFRQGKRLLKRYPPGHVAGVDGFFVAYSGQKFDPELEPRIVVSSRLKSSAEIWVLRLQTWETMSDYLKGPLTEMLCMHLADDSQHSRYQER